MIDGDGILDEARLREFLFTNSIDFYGAPDPDFFAWTVLERDETATRAAR